MQTDGTLSGPFHPPFRPSKPNSNNGISGTATFNGYPLYNNTATRTQDVSHGDYSQDPDGQLAESVANSVLQSPETSKRKIPRGPHGLSMEITDHHQQQNLFRQTWGLLIDFANKSTKQWDLVFGSKSSGSGSAGCQNDLNGFREVGHITDCNLRDLFDSLYSFIHVLYDLYQTRRSDISISTTAYEGLTSDIRSIGKQFINFATANSKDDAHKASSFARTWELIDTLYVSKYHLETKTSDRSIQTVMRLAAEKKAIFEMFVRTIESYFIPAHFREYINNQHANNVETENLAYRKYGAKLIICTWELCKALAMEESSEELVIDRVTNLAFEFKKVAAPYSLNASWNFASAYALARNMDAQAVKTVTNNRALFPLRNEDFLGERAAGGEYDNCSINPSDAQQRQALGSAGEEFVISNRGGDGAGNREGNIGNSFSNSTRLQNITVTQASPDGNYKASCAGSASGSLGNAAPSHLDEKAPIYAIQIRILLLACLKKHSSGNLIVQPPINVIRNTAYRLPRDILGRSGSSQDAAIQFRNAILDPNNLLSRGDKVLLEASVGDLAKAVLWKCREGRWQWLKDVFRDVVGLDPGQVPVLLAGDLEGAGNGIGSRKISLT